MLLKKTFYYLILTTLLLASCQKSGVAPKENLEAPSSDDAKSAEQERESLDESSKIDPEENKDPLPKDPPEEEKEVSGLKPGAFLRVAGSHTFEAGTKEDSEHTQWTISVGEAESLNETPQKLRILDTAQGQRFSYDLKAAALQGKFTFYRVEVKGRGFADTKDMILLDPKSMHRLLFKSKDSKTLRVYFKVPPKLTPASKLLFVFHGKNRNADEYCAMWESYPQASDTVVICPEFNERDWDGSSAYNLGNLFSSVSAEGRTGSLHPESQWSFTVVEHLYQWAKEAFAFSNKDFDAWGHSAGGQFVHRLALFKPNLPYRYVIPANPGWWTVGDLETVFPYGVNHPMLAVENKDLLSFSLKNLVIMRGTKDNDPRASGLRRNDIVDAQQGDNRFERAGHFFNTGGKIHEKSPWQLIDVPGVGHEGDKMAAAAMGFLKDNR